MATGNGRAPAMQQAMFSAFDEIVIEVQRVEREIFSEKTLCQKLTKRIEELDAEKKKVQEHTVSLSTIYQENFKKEVDAQAALDCITKTLQLEKDRHAGLRHQLEVANNKTIEQDRRLTAKEEKYRALWDSYKAVYEKFPLVREVQRMTDLVEHDKIKLMQANFELREAHDQLVQMDKISDLALKVELVNMAKIFCAHAAGERKIVEMHRRMSELQASVDRGMERKKQLLACISAKITKGPSQATLPISQVAAMPVASCTGHVLGNVTSLLNLQTLPQIPTLSAAYSRQASLDIVRDRYAKRSWPFYENSQSKSPLTLETVTSVHVQDIDYCSQNSEKATDIGYSSQKSYGEPMQVESSTQNQNQVLEVPMQINDLDSENLGSMEHHVQTSQINNLPMEEDVGPSSQGLPTADPPRECSQTEAPTNMDTNFSQDQSHTNQGPNNHRELAFPYQEGHNNIDVAKPPVTEIQTAPTLQDYSGKTMFEASYSVSSTTIHSGLRTASEQSVLVSGTPGPEARDDGRVTVVPQQQPEWPPTPFTPSTPLLEQVAPPGGLASQMEMPDGNDPDQAGERDDDMDGAPIASQDEFEGSQGDFSCSQQSVSNGMSRVEYLKKLKQSPEFHYAPRFMYQRQELGPQQVGSSSPYFQHLVPEVSAHRNQAGPSVEDGNQRDNEHSKELHVQLSRKDQLPYSQQYEQFSGQSIPNQQLPNHQAGINKPDSQPEVKQFSNQVMQAHELSVQQFSNGMPQGQQIQSQHNQHKTMQGQQSQGQQFSGQAELTRELRSQNDFQHAKIWPGSQEDCGAAQATDQSGSQGSATAQTAQQFESQGNNSVQSMNQPGIVNNVNEQTIHQFGSQIGHDLSQNITQATSQGDGFAGTSSQFMYQLSGQKMNQDNCQFTPSQFLSQGSEVLYTPRQSVGDGTRIEIGNGDFGESPLSAFTSPGETFGMGHQNPVATDLHDSSSNESFQYKSPCCSPPPSEPVGFSFMGSVPQQQSSMFGALPATEQGSGDAQQKPRSEAFTFNFSSNSSKPSVFKLF